MIQASQNGFANHGGNARRAANQISREVAFEAASQKAQSEFGDAGAAYLEGASMKTMKNGDSQLSITNTNEAMGLMAEAKKALGDDFQPFMEETVAQSASPKDMTRMIEERIAEQEPAPPTKAGVIEDTE